MATYEITGWDAFNESVEDIINAESEDQAIAIFKQRWDVVEIGELRQIREAS